MAELDWPDDCHCPPVNVGNERWWHQRAWSDICPEHGVGTDYFRKLGKMPFGFADERDTTREEWLAFKAGWEENDDEGC